LNFGKVELRENSAGDSCFRRNDGSPTPALPKGEGVFPSFGGVRGGEKNLENLENLNKIVVQTNSSDKKGNKFKII